jgi:hypothetical protein
VASAKKRNRSRAFSKLTLVASGVTGSLAATIDAPGDKPCANRAALERRVAAAAHFACEARAIRPVEEPIFQYSANYRVLKGKSLDRRGG